MLSLAMSALCVIFLTFMYNSTIDHAGIKKENDLNLFSNQIKTYIVGIILWPFVALMAIILATMHIILLLKRN